MTEMHFSELAFLETYLVSQILFNCMPSLMMKQSAPAEVRSPLTEVELYGAKLVHCPMDPRNSTVVLTKHFIVKSCSVEFARVISKLGPAALCRADES